MRAFMKLSVPVSSSSPESRWPIHPSTFSSSHSRPTVTSSPSSISPTTSPTASPPSASPSPSPSSSRRPTSLSSNPSFPPSPPPDPSSSPSPPTPPSPPASSTFATSPPTGSTFAFSPDVLRWVRSHPHPPSALLSDFFLGWANRLTADLAIPHVVFYSSGAFVVSILDDLEFMWEGLLANATGRWGTAINTFDDLEGPFLALLRRSYRRVWAVGPICNPPALIYGHLASRESCCRLGFWQDV